MNNLGFASNIFEAINAINNYFSLWKTVIIHRSQSKSWIDVNIWNTFEQGWIQHDLVGGCSASSGAELCRSCVPPAHQLASLLLSLAWLLFLNCNCCLQFAYHHVITQITVSHFVSNFFALSWKIAPPPPAPPLARARGRCTPPPVNPSLLLKTLKKAVLDSRPPHNVIWNPIIFATIDTIYLLIFLFICLTTI
jgi:hypothetical protein